MEINKTYKIIKYLHETTVIQEKEVVQMIIYDYLKCPHSVALLIASFVSDLEDDFKTDVASQGNKTDNMKKTNDILCFGFEFCGIILSVSLQNKSNCFNCWIYDKKR